MMIRRKLAALCGVVGGGLVSVQALAFTPTAINTADAVSQIGEIETAVAAIGGALLVAAAVAVAFKWAKAAAFG